MAKKKKRIKLISWNVNGLRAAIKKEFFASFQQMDADIFSIQETKIQEHQLTDEMKNIESYESWWSHATVKKGYSGVGTYSRIKPTRESVRDEERKAGVVNAAGADAEERGLPRNEIEALWDLLVETSIAYEFDIWDRTRG